ncbi:MAG: reverse transcriptase domain-containing protein [bacterium]|nr:reverse transcriptase domain-containing protein [bacterium]
MDKLCAFANLYKAHKKARLGKRDLKEIIEFEMNLSWHLVTLADALRNGSYRLSGYYQFPVFDPKPRIISALHYRDRVVQHCLCDEIIAPELDKRLVYDNAACRIGKGTLFAIHRVTHFLADYYKHQGPDGYFLKCDIRKFFDNIDHEKLKAKLSQIFQEAGLVQLLHVIIDSYETVPGKGLPLGNQTSQWFALYYLDEMDRLIKERLQIAYFSRYMDDMVLIHRDKSYLRYCLREMRALADKLGLEFNAKTKIAPLRNGIDYLGFHFYLAESGKIIRKVRQSTKKRCKKKLRYMRNAYAAGTMEATDIRQVVASYRGHMQHGHTWKLLRKLLGEGPLGLPANIGFVKNP